MKFKIKNNLDENKMTVTVTLSKRKNASDPVSVVRWLHVEEHVKNNYSVPETHFLGECLTKTTMATNRLNSSHLEESWEYKLIPKRQSKKTPSKKTPSKKKSERQR